PAALDERIAPTNFYVKRNLNRKKRGVPCWAHLVSACRKSLFDRLLNFLKLRSFKKLFDPTRKGTLTVPFHTILPSESFGGRVSRQPQTRCALLGAPRFCLFRLLLCHA